MNIYRILSDRLRKSAELFPVLVLTGPRQAGKTTLLRELFPKHNYVSLDLPSLAEAAETDPDSFFKAYPPPVLIDEVQYAPGLFRHIKRLVDQSRDSYGRFVLTGSQSFPLMREVSDSLAGRCVWFELENLSVEELVSEGLIDPKKPDWPALIVRGQFPELWKRPDLPTDDFMRSYVATYLERDVRQILNVSSLRDFERFLRLMAARSGSMLNKTEVAKDVGVAPKTIGDWVAVLQISGQITLLEPWYTSFNRRIVKTPKVYFRDSGLLCHLLGLDTQSLLRSPFLGPVWEGFVHSELRKLIGPMERPGRLWFYRDQAGTEVDLLHEKDGFLDFLETKWSEHPGSKDAAAISRLIPDLSASGRPEKPGRGLVIARNPLPYRIMPGIDALPPTELKGWLAGEEY